MTSFLQLQAQPFSLAGAGALIGDTSIVLKSFKDIGGTNITMTDLGSVGYMTLEPGNGTLEEQISFTGVTQNANGTATLTGVKTVLFKSPYTETSGLAKTHAGSTTAILSNTAGYYQQFVHRDNAETILGEKTFTSTAIAKYDSHPTFTTDTEIIDKKYADDLAIAGSPLATSSVYGLSKLSLDPATPATPIAVGDNDTRVPTQGENDALVGTSGTPSSTNKYVTNDDTSATATNNKCVRGNGSAKIDTGWINTGTSANQIVQLDSSAKLPAIDGSALTAVSSYSSGLTTRDAETASGTQTIAHGLGVIPKKVTLFATRNTNASPDRSHGTYDTFGQHCIWYETAQANGSGVSNSFAISIISTSTSDGYYSTGVVSVDATNITITWTRTQYGVGGGTTTYQILWEAFK